MTVIRFSRGAAGLLLIIITLIVNAQPKAKDARPPLKPIPTQPAELATGTATYIIRLWDEPAATYQGDVAGLATIPRQANGRKPDLRAPASIAYQKYLSEQQVALLAAIDRRLGRRPDLLYQYTVAYNGLALRLDGWEAAQLVDLPGIRDIQRDREYHPLTDVGPTWTGAPAIWAGSAAIQNKGEGIVIGVIDTGLNGDHPAFADVGGDGYNHTNPFGSGSYVGWCDPAHPKYDPAYACNDKLIGLWDFADAHGEADGPEDSDGHGSHTASTAAGNVAGAAINTLTGFHHAATISGVAPHANLIAYDACVDACPGAALVAAVNQAVADGVDVINFSISGGTAPYQDAVELAFLAANEAGVFVAAAAGNDGPNPSTLSHQSPWVTTVAASTHNRRFHNSLTQLTGVGVAPLANIGGKSLSGGYGPAPIVYAGDFGDALCRTPFAAGTWSKGEIVVCDRGEVPRVSKGAYVMAGGAGGFVLANTDAGQVINADAHYLPAMHIDYSAAFVLKTWLASGSGHMAAIAGTTVDYGAINGDVMAGFSSRGPNSAFDVIKPDVAAPGVDVLAAIHTTSQSIGPEYGLESGTSMAAPHVAGAAALLLGAHPAWSPDEIRSALMMTAVTDMVQENGVNAADPFDRGAGRVNLGQAVRAGLILDETKANYEAADPALGGDPRALNLPGMSDSACLFACSWTRTFRSALTASATWTASVDAPPGMTVTVTPNVFSLAAFAAQTVTITADVTHYDGSQGWAFADLILSSPGQADLHLPIAARKAYGSDLAALRKTAPPVAQPGQIVTYQIALDNLDGITHAFSLTDTLPAGVSYVPGSATGGLVYDAAARQLAWSGDLGPGASGYEIAAVSTPAYVNLGGVGGTDLCGSATLQGDCDEGAVIYDLAAANSASYTFYGESLTQIIASSNGLLYGPDGQTGPACLACPQRLPEPTEPNQVMAGLWRDVDMRNSHGQWYAAVITGLLDNPSDKVFYVNWHDAGQFGAPLATSRNAIAVVLDGQSEPAGRLYYIYGDIRETAVLEREGFSIGVENKTGLEGLTYAFAPCLSGACVPASATGELPADGTVLRLDPAIVGGSSAKIFTYQVQITAAAGTLLTNIAEATSDGPTPYLTALADLPVTYRQYLPLIKK